MRLNIRGTSWLKRPKDIKENIWHSMDSLRLRSRHSNNTWARYCQAKTVDTCYSINRIIQNIVKLGLFLSIDSLSLVKKQILSFFYKLPILIIRSINLHSINRLSKYQHRSRFQCKDCPYPIEKAAINEFDTMHFTGTKYI